MTVEFRKGRYGVRLAKDSADLLACQALRHQCFFGRAGVDADAFDLACDHIMIAGDAGLVATLRLHRVDALPQTYAAQRYDLRALARYPRPMLELGRFCRSADGADADVLRLAWGGVAQIVDAQGIGLIFGCSSFAGLDPAAHRDAFGLLAQRYPAPPAYAPGRASLQTIALAQGGYDHRAALLQMPPLLRSYLSMGGWVSDHGVLDAEMHTIHVFTALEVDRIPAARAAVLRSALA